MSEYTPITGELRTAMVEFNGEPAMRLDVFNRCVDAIDAVHAQLERENAALKAELDRVLGEDERGGWVEHPEEVMAEHGWVRGPLDADGEMWHRGDMSDSPWGEIESIAFDGYHWQISGHDTSAPWIRADSVRHATPDTWERIIEDARTCTGSAGNYTSVPTMRWTNELDALVARCKALCERTKEES